MYYIYIKNTILSDPGIPRSEVDDIVRDALRMRSIRMVPSILERGVPGCDRTCNYV